MALAAALGSPNLLIRPAQWPLCSENLLSADLLSGSCGGSWFPEPAEQICSVALVLRKPAEQICSMALAAALGSPNLLIRPAQWPLCSENLLSADLLSGSCGGSWFPEPAEQICSVALVLRKPAEQICSVARVAVLGSPNLLIISSQRPLCSETLLSRFAQWLLWRIGSQNLLSRSAQWLLRSGNLLSRSDQWLLRSENLLSRSAQWFLGRFLAPETC